MAPGAGTRNGRPDGAAAGISGKAQDYLPATSQREGGIVAVGATLAK